MKMNHNQAHRSARNAQRLAEDLRLASITEEVCDRVSAVAALSELLCGSSDVSNLVDEVANAIDAAHDMDATMKDYADNVVHQLVTNLLGE